MVHLELTEEEAKAAEMLLCYPFYQAGRAQLIEPRPFGEDDFNFAAVAFAKLQEAIIKSKAA